MLSLNSKTIKASNEIAEKTAKTTSNFFIGKVLVSDLETDDLRVGWRLEM